MAEFEDHHEGRFTAEAAFGPGGSKAHRGEGAFDRIGGSQVLPVLGREVVEGEQLHPVLGQAGDGLVVLGTEDFHEEVEGFLGLVLGFGHPDVLQALLDLGLDGLRQLVQHSVDLAQGLPEPKGAVASGQFGRNHEAPLLEVEKQFAPGLGTFAITVVDGQYFLAAPIVGADDDQNALAIFVQARLEIDAVSPEIDVALGGQVPPLPALQLLLPDLLETHDGVGRKARRVRTHERCQGVGKITRGDAFEIKPGQQFLDRFAAPQIGRQDRRCKTDLLRRK